VARASPGTHAREVLLAPYRYYRGNRKMWRAVDRDVEKVPALEAPLAVFEAYLTEVRTLLLADWEPSRSPLLQATLGHALRFSTWSSPGLRAPRRRRGA